MQRYTAWLKPDRSTWTIFDTHMFDYCSLTDEDGNEVPLEWLAKPAAEAWLDACYRRWFTWESQGKPVPAYWRPRKAPAEPSPFPISMPVTPDRRLEP